MRITSKILTGMLGVWLLTSSTSLSGEKKRTQKPIGDFTERGDFRIMFYNVENLFYPYNDSLKNDDEFTPEGMRRWSWERYREKCLKVAKTIVAVGGWEAPDLVGVCEIENRSALDGIVNCRPLVHSGYKIIHRESPDRRGIDVALLYQSERFSPLKTNYLSLIYSGRKKSTTREILYVKGVTHTDDTLHVFVNHWPSRWGGQLESEGKRILAAKLLRNCLDSINNSSVDAQIIIMGDFNDYPQNKSIAEVLGACSLNEKIKKDKLYNLAAPLQETGKEGSHKYKGEWGMLDQIIVSGALLKGTGILSCKDGGMQIFKPDFLLEQDKTYYGVKPYRTYSGYKYHGGFSDHLPVFLDLWR